jgi:Skp family chaperone for outer membrane proteins
MDEKFTFTFNDGRAVELPKIFEVNGAQVDLSEIINHAGNASRQRTKTDYEAKLRAKDGELATLKGEYETLTAQLTEFQDKSLPAKDKALKDLEAKLKQFETKQSEADAKAKAAFDKFRAERVNNDILRAVNASGVEFHNPKHAVDHFLSDVRVELGEENENYTTKVSATLPNTKGEFENVTGKPEEVFGKWVALESNAYLVKNKLAPGGGTTKGGATGGLVFRKSEVGSIPEVTKAFNEALRTNSSGIKIIDD